MITCLLDGDVCVGHTWINQSLGYAMHGQDKYVHRTVMEHFLGRRLSSHEVVHHINHNKLDNRLANLLLCSQAEHIIIHTCDAARNAGFNCNTHCLCSICKTYHPLEAFAKSKHKWNGVHNICKRESNRIRRERQYNKGKFDWRARMHQQFRRALKNGVPLSVVSMEGRRP